jgi:hypothetical protein
MSREQKIWKDWAKSVLKDSDTFSAWEVARGFPRTHKEQITPFPPVGVGNWVRDANGAPVLDAKGNLIEISNPLIDWLESDVCGTLEKS